MGGGRRLPPGPGATGFLHAGAWDHTPVAGSLSKPPGRGEARARAPGAPAPARTYRTVANIKSQKKRILTNAKRAERNKSVRSEMKTRTKTAVRSAEQGADAAPDAARLAMKRIDKAASKGVIHKNAAARRKSRLQKKLNLVGSAQG